MKKKEELLFTSEMLTYIENPRDSIPKSELNRIFGIKIRWKNLYTATKLKYTQSKYTPNQNNLYF